MTINEIMSMDLDKLMKLNRRDLSKLTSSLASAANKRLRRLEKSGINSNAYAWSRRSGGDFSVAGKDLNQLRHEFKRTRDFLQAKTSTHKGAKSVEKEFEKRIGGKLPDERINDFWEVYNKAIELNPGWAAPSLSSSVQTSIHDVMSDYPEMSVDEMLDKVVNRMTEAYEEWQEEENEYWEEETEEGDDFFFM